LTPSKNDIRAYVALGKFDVKGMTIDRYTKTPNLDKDDLDKLVTYYSIILGLDQSSGNLYGPLPLAYKFPEL
jgi:hypothetical protein